MCQVCPHDYRAGKDNCARPKSQIRRLSRLCLVAAQQGSSAKIAHRKPVVNFDRVTLIKARNGLTMFDTASHLVPAPVVAVMMTLHANDRLDHFEEALRSLETQEGVGEIHIYLCCDGPLSAEQNTWLKSNAARFFTVLRNDNCLGLAASLNRLIDVLGPESFVFRMDGDDISHPARFATQISWLEANPELGLIGCQVMDIDDDGAPLAPRTYPQDAGRVRRLLTRLNPVLHPTFCMRRDVLESTKARYPDAYLTEDLAFLIRLSELGVQIGNCPQTLFSWRTGAAFFKRRSSFKRGWTEMRWYARAVYMQDGLLSAAYIYPLLRLTMRILPQSVLKRAYRTGMRSAVSQGKAPVGDTHVASEKRTFSKTERSDGSVASVSARSSVLRVD